MVEKDKVYDLMSKELLNTIKRIEGGEAINNYDENFKIRLIPFSSLGKQNGMLVGVRAQKVAIMFKEKEEIIDNVILGIYDGKFSKDNRYNALIGLDVVEIENKKLETV